MNQVELNQRLLRNGLVGTISTETTTCEKCGNHQPLMFSGELIGTLGAVVRSLLPASHVKPVRVKITIQPLE